MKIAINLSGYTRNYKGNTYNSIKNNILDKYDCDVFISTWKQSGKGIRFLDNPELYKSNTSLINETELLDLYKPKKYKIYDENIDFIDDYIKWFSHLKSIDNIDIRNKYHFSPQLNFFNVSIMFNNIMNCNNLIKTYMINERVSYDFILRLRFDILYTKCDLSSITDPNYLYFWTNPECPEILGFYDTFWIGGVNPTFDMTYKFYKHLDHMKNEKTFNSYFSNEQWLYSFINSLNIPYKKNNDFMMYSAFGAYR